MKRLYVCIFILMAVVAVSFCSLIRVRRGSRQLSFGIDDACTEFKRTGTFPEGRVTALVSEWEDYCKSISFAENTNELNEISRLFAALESAEDEADFIKESSMIRVSLMLLCENEYPHLYSVL